MADQIEEQNDSTLKNRLKNFFGNHWRGVLTVVIPIVLLPLFFVSPPKEFRCMYIVLLMALYWVAEIIPLHITSLIPIFAFPLLDILDSRTVCNAYFTDALILFFSGLLVALAIEFSNLHYRIAFGTILLIGCSPRKLNFGLVFVTMFLSMWISNAAATAMFCPIIKAVLMELNSQGLLKLTTDDPVENEEPPVPSKTVVCYYLGVAYASSIGGCGTLIGTGTNLTYKGLYETRFPDATDVTFVGFFLFGAPAMLIEMLLTYYWLQFLLQGLLRPNSPEGIEVATLKENKDSAKAVIQKKYEELGSITAHEVQVAIIFIMMIVLLFTRAPGIFTGYADILNLKKIKGSLPITFCAFLLFVLPRNYSFLRYLVGKRPEKESTQLGLISWKFVQQQMPWGLMFLLGGGFALAKGLEVSGFAKMVGNFLGILKTLPLPATQLICIIAGVFMTAFSSNVAICNILIPVLCELSIAIQVHPLYLTLPASIACSMAFHLPVSTPPNAIVAGYANIRTKQMALGGVGPTVITIAVLFLCSQTLIFLVFPQVKTFPDWAK